MASQLRHQAARSPRVSAALALALAAALTAVAALAMPCAGAPLVATLLWVAAIAVMAYRVFVTGRVGRWRSTFFIILAFAFLVHFKSNLIGLTGSPFIAAEAQEVPTCHIALASSFLNHLYQQYLAFTSGAWRQWSPLTWGALWLVVTLVLGQAWCSWACVYGGLDSAFSRLSRRPRLKWRRLPKGVRDAPAAVLVAMLLLSLVTLQPIFCLWMCPLKLSTGFLDPTTRIRMAQLAIFSGLGVVFLIVLPWLTKKRAFCGLVCPFGAWQAFFGRLNPYRVRIRAEGCIQCRRCIMACPTFAIDEEGLKSHQVSPYCNRCGECMDACPTGVIDYALAGKRLTLPPGAARVTFLLTAWLVAGSLSLRFVPEVLVAVWRWMAAWGA
jgi:ferredoxin